MKCLKIFFLMLFMPLILSAGEIYGTIMIGKTVVGNGIKVEISCAGRTYTKRTDKHGFYSIYVEGRGQGLLTVYYPENGTSKSSIKIHSYEKSEARYDLDLIWNPENNRYILQRK